MSDLNAISQYDMLNMPYSPEAEQSVLGAILLDSECLNLVAEILPKAEYFHIHSNKMIYSAMLQMFSEGKNIDVVTLINHLEGNSKFDKELDRNYLLTIAQAVPSVSNVQSYAYIVRDKYDLKNLILTARGILDEAGESGKSSSELLDLAEQRIFDIRNGKNIQGLQRVNEIVIQTLDRLDALNSEDNDLYKGIPTGISDLDNVITGLNRSDLILLAARPGMGKTSFALNMASHAAQNCQFKVAFFSLEMTKEQLVSRLISSLAMVDGTKLRTGQLDENEWTRIIEASDILSNVELYLDDTPRITVPEMKAKLRRLKNVDAVFIDYLQLMGSSRRIENRVQEISEITRSLKIMAKELNVPVVLLSQLSRASEQRTEHRPMLSDLRDSGSIEQDADIVLFLFRESYYNQNNTEIDEDINNNSGECIVAKNRHGETRTVNLHWQGEYMRFTASEVIHIDEY